MSDSDIAANNRRIAKNTLYLYGRMLFSLVVSLFTARIVFNALGVHDYGVLNVVGSFVSMLTYLNMLLQSGTRRFVTIALGRGNIEEMKQTFSGCLTMHLIIAIVTLLIGETVGLWFVNNKLVIDAGRMAAANVVYQFSLMSMFLSIMQAPYMAAITAHEKMSVYAYISIYDVVMKLVVIYLLLHISGDKLIFYSLFYFCVGLSTTIFYRVYCIRKFVECSMRFAINKPLYKEIFNYVGWNAIGAFAGILTFRGLDVLLNIFFGPVVNAARGIAMRICDYINGFVSNFYVAANPQTIKYYASGNVKQMNRLIMNNSKYSSYLLLIIGLWAFLEVDYVLFLWLGNVPEHTVAFVRLAIIQCFVQSMDITIESGIHAYGKMRLPNITVSIVQLSILPISYVAFMLGASAEAAYIVMSCAYTLAVVLHLWILNKYSGFDWRKYLLCVVGRVFIVYVASAVIPVLMHITLEYGILRFLSVSAVSVATAIASVYWIGLSADMRSRVRRKAVSVARKKLRL